MFWHVQYQHCGEDRVARFDSPELAIEAACGFMDDGCTVLGLGMGSLDDTIAADQIARIYAIWKRANP